jgi:S-layer protein
MAKRKKKMSRSHLKLEALEARQLLAGVTGAGTEVGSDIHHPNGNVYDQVLMTGTSVSVTADAGQITRVSFLDMQGDIVQAEFSGAGQLTISLDGDTAKANVDPTGYNQTGVKYEQGLASFTIQGTDATTNFNVFSVGSLNAVNAGLFDSTHTGGDHTADVSRITVVADPANPNGSVFGGITAGNAKFSADSGVVGIAAANVQVQNKVVVGDIDAKGSATPTLVFGTASQFGDVVVAGGDLSQSNGKAINNTNSYNFSLTLAAGTKSDGTAIAAQSAPSGLAFTGNNPLTAQAKTFDLTSGVDTIVGTDGNDTINGTDTTVTGLDTINGGAGNDTLTINDVTGANASLSLLSVSNVETFNLNSTKGLAGNALDTSSWSGLTTETLTLGSGTAAGQTVTAAKTTNVNVVDPAAQTLTVIGGGGTLNVQNGAAQIDVGQTAVANAYTSAFVKGGTVVNVEDRSGDSAAVGSTLTSVTLDGNTGLATLTSDGLTSVTLKNLSASTTIANTKDHALTAGVNTVTGGTITDTTATSVTINSTGDSKGITLTAGAAKSVTLNGSSGKLTIADVNIGAAETITVTGSKDVTVAATTGVAALKSVDASAATAGVTITPALGNSVAYKGGSGSDSITLGATTKAITTGAGDDTVTLSVSALGSGGTVDAGDGSDTLAMSSTNAVAASASTTLADKISGFEKLSLGTFATGNAEVKLNNLDGINWVSVSGNTDANPGTADVLTLSGASSGGTLKITGAATTPADGDGYAVVLKDASASDDSYTAVVSNVAGINAGTVDLSGIETVTLNTDDTASTPSGITHTVALTDSSAKTITVWGDAGAALTFTGTAVTSVDASGITKGGLNWTAGALANAASIKGSAGADNITATAATKSVTIDAGDGANFITVNNSNANTITSGKDVDTITTGTGADTINAGAGNDVISSGKGLDMVTGGAGNDTFKITTPNNGNSYGTITDLSAGDMVQGLSLHGTLGWTGGGSTAGKITLASTAAFQDYLDAAASGDGSTNSVAAWFQYNGDTFIVIDNSSDATFHNGQDVVVKASGPVDLSSSTIAGGIVTVV